MHDLTTTQWCWAVAAAFGIGFSKAGFAGVGLFHVIVFAWLFGSKTSTGIVLPLLIIGDITAVLTYRQHTRWEYVRRVLPPAVFGVVLGWLLMEHLTDAGLKPLLGIIVLGLALLQIARMWRPEWFNHVPHARGFAVGIGIVAGFATMLANAAGPIVAIYLLAIGLPKFELVGTSSWFFFIVNVLKIPFSAEMGLIRPDTLMLNLTLLPAVIVGWAIGRRLVRIVQQRFFDSILLVLVIVAALRMLGVFEWIGCVVSP